MPSPTLYTSFIGIDAYPRYPLRGCVRDVLAMDLLLRQQMAQNNAAYQPTYFLAPNQAGISAISDYAKAQKIEINYKAPTFETVTTAAFAHLKQATAGDTCILFYSGHGSQADAPEEFHHTKPDKQNETIVCVDSRDAANATSRDIIDKELAFLLWDALENKDVHCLVIMDCCHSGNNTREFMKIGDTDIRYRHCPSSKNQIPFEQYLGYDKGFYTINNSHAGIKIARYVHLAAARDFEKAQDAPTGGLFTRKLMDTLRAGGTAKSYRELVQALGITVNNRATQQNPVAYAREDTDLDLQFLGKAIKPYQPSFEVRYHADVNKWILYGGTIHNIVPSSDTAKTTVKIIGTSTEAAVTEVMANTAYLDEDALTALDKGNEQYSAIITSLANPKSTVSLSETLLQQPVFTQALREAYNYAGHLYYEIDFDCLISGADYLVQLSNNNDFMLTKPDSQLPLFKREKDAGQFLKDVEAVCKWKSVSELNNTNTAFTKDDFIFRLEKIEGKHITPHNSADWETFNGTASDITPGNEQIFNYQGEIQPAFRLSITLKNPALQSCYIGALYMDNMYGINHTLIRHDNNRLLNSGAPLHLQWQYKGEYYKTIALRLDKAFRDNNINEITDFLKIFVGTEPLNLERYQQESLKPDVVRSNTKSFGFDDDDTSTIAKPDWAVFTFPFRIVGPGKEKKLEQGILVEFSSFKIEAPKHFTATAYAATGNDVQQKLNAVSRSADGEEQQLSQMIAPPESIWGDVLSSETLFTAGLAQAADSGIRVLELQQTGDGTGLQLQQGEEILISPKLHSRSIDDSNVEETTIPFGYDEAAQMYIPLGFADDYGIIHIGQLPPPTPGIISGPQELTRSIGSSVKLFFKKILRIKKLNTLALYKLQAGKEWSKLTEEPAEMKPIFEGAKEVAIVLMIHGIIGDMKCITEAMMEVEEFSATPRFVLAYDYENLSTPTAKTAAALGQMLATAGFGSTQKLSIVAHSMGGLVARWLVEKEGADKYVSQVIFAGTPHAGSEMAALKSSISGLLTHALNVTGPIKYVITGLSFLIKKLELNPGKTLEEMSPGSDLLIRFSESAIPPGVTYSVIGANTYLLEKEYTGNDFFLKKIGDALARNILYPGLTLALFQQKPNDMAVSIESMKNIPGLPQHHFHELAGNHLTYFTDATSRNQLLLLLAPVTNHI